MPKPQWSTSRPTRSRLVWANHWFSASISAGETFRFTLVLDCEYNIDNSVCGRAMPQFLLGLLMSSHRLTITRTSETLPFTRSTWISQSLHSSINSLSLVASVALVPQLTHSLNSTKRPVIMNRHILPIRRRVYSVRPRSTCPIRLSTSTNISFRMADRSMSCLVSMRFPRVILCK